MIPYLVFDYFYLGPVKIYTWGLFVGLAFTAGYLLTLFQAKKKNIPFEKIFWLTLTIFFGAALGSRVAFLLQDPQGWLADVSLLWRVNQGGLMIWGGILGAIFFGWFYVKKAKLEFWKMADLVTPAIALGIGIGRIGCFLINDHQGAPTNLPWGILWPDGIARHPVALYESLVGFALFAILLFLERRLSQRPASGGALPSAGRLFLLFLANYSIIRFLLDFFRASDGIFSDPRWWGLTSSQWISIAILFFVSIIFLRQIKEAA